MAFVIPVGGLALLHMAARRTLCMLLLLYPPGVPEEPGGV